MNGPDRPGTFPLTLRTDQASKAKAGIDEERIKKYNNTISEIPASRFPIALKTLGKISNLSVPRSDCYPPHFTSQLEMENDHDQFSCQITPVLRSHWTSPPAQKRLPNTSCPGDRIRTNVWDDETSLCQTVDHRVRYSGDFGRWRSLWVQSFSFSYRFGIFGQIISWCQSRVGTPRPRNRESATFSFSLDLNPLRL